MLLLLDSNCLWFTGIEESTIVKGNGSKRVRSEVEHVCTVLWFPKEMPVTSGTTSRIYWRLSFILLFLKFLA